MANLGSVKNAFEAVGAKTEVTNKPEDIASAKLLVLPGVGAFGDAMKNIRSRGVDSAICEAIENGAQFLGICLGLQVLFTESEEHGLHRGLNLLKGKIRRFREGLVPQIGWNQAKIVRDDPLFEGIPDESFFYFVHSYYAEPEEKTDIIALTDYHISYSSVVGRGRIRGIQFHPEKSQNNGLKILQNFTKLK